MMFFLKFNFGGCGTWPAIAPPQPFIKNEIKMKSLLDFIEDCRISAAELTAYIVIIAAAVAVIAITN